jgi:hypothetical protein
MSLNARIAAGWILGLSALWALLHFVFHVPNAWAWPLVVALAVRINGYIADNHEGDSP